MRFIHTSDLHIGKTVSGFSMLEEQEAALKQIMGYVKERQADAVLLSGDLYDRSVPPAAAVTMFDAFLTGLSEMGVTILAIAGNHDCGERIGFANRILEKRGLYLEGKLEAPVRFVDIPDQWGFVRVHLAPFAKPAEVRSLYRCEGSMKTFEESFEEILRHVTYSPGGRDILMAHQFVVNQGLLPELSDSETRVTVGGTDQVEAALFQPFCYTALGHIHGCQQIGKNPVYYSGSPVKYSFSECSHRKSVLYGEVGENGKVTLERLPLTPVHDMRKIRGRLADLILPEVVSAADPEDYILAVLTDETELLDPIGTLRSVYPNIMQLKWEKRAVEQDDTVIHDDIMKDKGPYGLFADFYELVTGKTMSEEQEAVMRETAEQAEEEVS